MGMISCLLKATDQELESMINDPEDLADRLYDEENEANNCDLDKSWHAIHFLINQAPWEVTTLAGSLILGGKPVSDEDLGYGPARYFTSAEVSEVNEALSKISERQLFENYDAMLEEGSEIYISFENTPEDKEYIGSYFNTLKDFCAKAASENKCLISYMT